MILVESERSVFRRAVVRRLWDQAAAICQADDDLVFFDEDSRQRGIGGSPRAGGYEDRGARFLVSGGWRVSMWPPLTFVSLDLQALSQI